MTLFWVIFWIGCLFHSIWPASKIDEPEIFYMRKYILIIVTAFLLNSCNAQQLDSIKYAYGYIYYHDYGKGQPVIILSGGPGVSCEQEQEVAIEVSKNYRAILLEQRGTGRSIPTPFDSTTINLKAALDDLNLLLDHLKLKDAIFYGHSWGGMLAMSFATSYPNRAKAIILTGTGPWTVFDSINPPSGLTQSISIMSHLDKHQRQRYDSLNMKEKAGIMTAEELTERRKLILLGRIPNRGIIDSIYPRYAVGIMNNKMGGLMWQDLGRIHFDLTSKFSSYHNPFFAIFGLQDPAAFITYELKILLPRVQLQWIQNSGHFPMFDQPEEFYKILNADIEKVKN